MGRTQQDVTKKRSDLLGRQVGKGPDKKETVVLQRGQ